MNAGVFSISKLLISYILATAPSALTIRSIYNNLFENKGLTQTLAFLHFKCHSQSSCLHVLAWQPT